MKSPNITFLGLVSIFIVFLSCDFFTGKMCGEINSEEKKEIIRLEKKYGFEIETIPCEFRYVNVIIENTSKDTLLYSLHKEIINSNVLNYSSIQVYDARREKMFEQHYSSYKGSFSRTNSNDYHQKMMIDNRSITLPQKKY